MKIDRLLNRKHTAYRKRVRPTRAKGLQVDVAVVLGKASEPYKQQASKVDVVE